MERLRNTSNISSELQELRNELASTIKHCNECHQALENTITVNLKYLLVSKEFRWQLITAVTLHVTQQLSGINAVKLSLPIIFISKLEQNICIYNLNAFHLDILLFEWHLQIGRHTERLHTVRHISDGSRQLDCHIRLHTAGGSSGPKTATHCAHDRHCIQLLVSHFLYEFKSKMRNALKEKYTPF